MNEPKKEVHHGEPEWNYQVCGIKPESANPQFIVDFLTSKSRPNTDPDDGGAWEFVNFMPVEGVVMLFRRPAKKIVRAVVMP